MRKIYSFIVFATLMLLSSASFAQTMTTENAVLDQWGYRLEKNVNFVAGTVNGKDINPKNSLVDGGLEDYKINGQTVNKIKNEGLEFLSIEILGNGIDWPEGHGLRSTKNERWICVNNLRMGQILAFEITRADTVQFVVNSAACNNNTGWADTPTDPLIVEPISGSIHELQELAEEGSADAYRYFKVINPGTMYAKFNGKQANEILSMQIWSDKNDAEVVSAPSMKVVGVKDDSRRIEFKSGESTFGSDVYTYYTLDGSNPVYLKDSEVIDYYVDAAGNVVSPDTVPDAIPIYKKVINMDEVFESDGFIYYGDNYYNPSDGYIEVFASDDEDGDGIVDIKFATVSANGVVSQIVTESIEIGSIVLNTPTLTLAGFNGLERTYTIGWSNNTFCGEDYMFVVEADGSYSEYEPNTGIGTSVVASSTVKVTVKVEGYTSSSIEETVAMQGTPIVRKNSGVHDWDFVNLTELQKALLTQDASYSDIITGCYVVSGEGEVLDTVYYSKEEYIEGVGKDGKDLTAAEPTLMASGWGTPDGNSRCTRSVATQDTYSGTLYNVNDNGYGYVEDNVGMFTGFTVDCAPNANNNSTYMQYIDTGDWTDGGYNGDGITKLGMYFMARPTFTFPREVAKAGEFVAIYYGQGNSKGTSTRTLGIYEVPTTEPLSVILPNGGVHVFYIDVYTYDNLPADEFDPTAVQSVEGAAKVTAIYSANGARLSAPQKGINIVKMSDGSVKKIMIK